MDLRFAHRENFPAVITDGVKPFWRRLFGDFVGLPAAFFISALAILMLDCWFIVEDETMTKEVVLHVALTLTLSIVLTLATAYWQKRSQCRIKLARVPRLSNRQRR